MIEIENSITLGVDQEVILRCNSEPEAGRVAALMLAQSVDLSALTGPSNFVQEARAALGSNNGHTGGDDPKHEIIYDLFHAITAIKAEIEEADTDPYELFHAAAVFPTSSLKPKAKVPIHEEHIPLLVAQRKHLPFDRDGLDQIADDGVGKYFTSSGRDLSVLFHFRRQTR